MLDLESRKKIKRLLTVSGSSNERAITTDELVALALAEGGQKSKIVGQILVWIAVHCPEHRDSFADSVDNFMLGGIVSKVRERMDMYDRAVERVITGNKTLYSITPGNATTMLRRIVLPRRTRTFPFMGLPAEIRCSIYDLVLTFPERRILVRNKRKCWLSEGPILGSMLLWDNGGDPLLTVSSLNKMLATLSVSRQIHIEASPVFYRQNHFVFNSMSSLHDFLKRIGPVRRSHLTRLAVNFVSRQRGVTVSPHTTFAMLKDCLALRSICIGGIVEAGYFLESLPQDRAEHNSYIFGKKKWKLKGPSSLPGVIKFGTLRGVQELTFKPPCPRIDAWLRPRITTPRPQPKKPRLNKKKRKAGEEDTGVQGEPAHGKTVNETKKAKTV